MDLPVELIWFLVGLVLILLEFAAPGVIVVFFGVGAWITALTTWIGLTDGLAGQLVAWSGSSVLLLVLLRRRLADRFHGFESGQQDPMANLDDPLGTEVLVTRDIGPEHRDGRVEYKGAEWTAVAAESVVAGRLAVITAVDGLTLHVRPVASGLEPTPSADLNEGE